MSEAIAAEIAEYEYQIEQISGALEADPANDELLTLKNELQDLIVLTRARLSAADEGDKIGPKTVLFSDKDKKRKTESGSRKVGDVVLAKWISGDHHFYEAKITSITGNQADPVYAVKFLEYNEIQTLHGHQLRDLNEHKKRALETSFGAKFIKTNPVPPPPPSSVPAPPSSLTKESVLDTTKPATKKKGPSTKESLAQSANNWTSFAKSGPKTTKKVGKRKAIGEGSMFRTEEGGRVGVIGSGRAMTSDPGKRARHVFESDRY